MLGISDDGIQGFSAVSATLAPHGNASAARPRFLRLHLLRGRGSRGGRSQALS